MPFSGTATVGVEVVATDAVGLVVGEAIGVEVEGVEAAIGPGSGSFLSLAQPQQIAPVNKAVVASFVMFIAEFSFSGVGSCRAGFIPPHSSRNKWRDESRPTFHSSEQEIPL